MPAIGASTTGVSTVTEPPDGARRVSDEGRAMRPLSPVASAPASGGAVGPVAAGARRLARPGDGLLVGRRLEGHRGVRRAGAGEEDETHPGAVARGEGLR